MIFFLISTILALLSIIENKRLFNISIFSVGLYFCINYGYGYDWINYRSTYSHIDNPGYSIFFSEPGFYFLMRFFNFINISFPGFIAFVSFFIYYSVYVFCARMKNPSLAFFTLFSLLGFFVFSEWIRQGVALSIIMLGMYFIEKKKNLLFLLCIFLASFFHISALCVLAYFILKVNNSRNCRLAIFSASIFIILLLLGLSYPSIFQMIPVVGDKISAYAMYSSDNSINPLSYILGSRIIFVYLLLLLLLVYLNKKSEDKVYNGMGSTFFLLISRFSPVLIRIGYLFVPMLAYSMDSLMASKGKGLRTSLIKILYIFVLLMLSTVPYWTENFSKSMNTNVTIFSSNYEINKVIYEKCSIVKYYDMNTTIADCLY